MIFTVSGKDRSAIALGGKRPDAAYWFDEKSAQGFTTSRYYEEALPAWVGAWHGKDPLVDGWLRDLPERWEHATGAPANGARADDFVGEIVDGRNQPPFFVRTSPCTLACTSFGPMNCGDNPSFAICSVSHASIGSRPAMYRRSRLRSG